MFFRQHPGHPAFHLAAAFGGRPGFGPFGRGPGSRGGGGGGFRSGRLLRDGDLRLVALHLVNEAPRHGYDIIKALEERSGGFYSPSPGVVYPTLSYLEDVGYATSASDGNKKVFTIADSGRAFLDDNRAQVEATLQEIEHFGQRMAAAREWWDGRDQSEASTESNRSPAAAELERARKRLRGLILAAIDGTEADQKRVADALNRAADEILGQAQPG